MTKLMRNVVTAIIACMVLGAAVSSEAKGLKSSRQPTAPHAALGDRVTLEVSGVEGEQAVAALNKTFADNGLKATVKEGKKSGKSLRLMAAVDKMTDLAPWSKAVMSAVPAKKGQSPPSLDLVFYASLTKESSAQAMTELEKLKGVDVKRSTLDSKRGRLSVRISGADHVTAEEIANAVKNAGITDSHFARAKTKTKKA